MNKIRAKAIAKQAALQAYRLTLKKLAEEEPKELVLTDEEADNWEDDAFREALIEELGDLVEEGKPFKVIMPGVGVVEEGVGTGPVGAGDESSVERESGEKNVTIILTESEYGDWDSISEEFKKEVKESICDIADKLKVTVICSILAPDSDEIVDTVVCEPSIVSEASSKRRNILKRVAQQFDEQGREVEYEDLGGGYAGGPGANSGGEVKYNPWGRVNKPEKERITTPKRTRTEAPKKTEAPKEKTKEELEYEEWFNSMKNENDPFDVNFSKDKKVTAKRKSVNNLLRVAAKVSK